MNDKIKVIVVTDGERPYRYLISAENIIIFGEDFYLEILKLN